MVICQVDRKNYLPGFDFEKYKQQETKQTFENMLILLFRYVIITELDSNTNIWL